MPQLSKRSAGCRRSVLSRRRGQQGSPEDRWDRRSCNRRSVAAAWTCLLSRSLRIILSESERAKAVQYSGTPGGDGIGVTIDILDDALRDMANNPIAAATGLAVSETPDTILPFFLSLVGS